MLVDTTGALAGKTVVAIAAGTSHSLALCDDSTMATWGDDSYGQLGNGSALYTQSSQPVLFNRTGVLSGETVVGIAAGGSLGPALCQDGTLATWGSSNSTIVPLALGTTSLRPGEQFFSAASGPTAGHSFGLVGSPLQSATPLPATAITGLSATLNGSVNGNANAVGVAFEYGLTTAYGHTLAGAPATVSGTSDTSVSAAIGGLTPGTIHHYRVVTTGYGGTVRSADMTFTTLSDDAKPL